MNMFGGAVAQEGTRKSTIMAGATYAKSVTGNLYIDEEVLREEDVKDFDQYAEDPGTPLLPDFFLPGRLIKDFDSSLLEKLTQGVDKSNDKGLDQSLDDSGPVAGVFASTSAVMTDDMRDDINATLHFLISGKGWTLVSKKGEPFQSEQPEKADVTLITDDITL